MLGTYSAALVICGASLLVGYALLALTGGRSWCWLEGGVGFAALIGLGGAAAWASGSAVAATVALGLLVAAAAVVSMRTPRLRLGNWQVGAAVSVLLLIALALPFLAAGHWGLLGADGLTAQLRWGDWLRGGPAPPAENVLGPEALAEALATVPGLSRAQAFQGELFAVVVLSGLTALGALGRLSPWRRGVGACAAALAYMSACFLGLAAVSTTAEALFVLTTAVALLQIEQRLAAGEPPGPAAAARGAALALALGLGIFFSNSVFGLIWPAAILARWSLNRQQVRERLRLRSLPRRLAGPATALAAAAVAGLALLAIYVVPFSVDRLAAGTGDPVAPAAGLGVWFHGSYPLSGGYSTLDWAATALAGATLLVALLWWLRRRETAIPVAFGISSVIYLLQPLLSGHYSRAEALAIVAPLAMLVAARPLLEEAGGEATPLIRDRLAPRRAERDDQRRAGWAVLAVAFIGAAACSSGLALTHAPVASAPAAGGRGGAMADLPVQSPPRRTPSAVRPG